MRIPPIVLSALLSLAFIYLFITQQAIALNISLDYKESGEIFTLLKPSIGSAESSSPSQHGGGDLQNVMRAAADTWESLIDFDYDLTISYGWQGSIIPGIGGATRITTDGNGHVNRGVVRFKNTSSVNWFMDPTPEDNAEWERHVNSSHQQAGHVIQTGNQFYGGNSDAANNYDLYSVALHEMGHLLGISSGFQLHKDEYLPDNEVNIRSPLPYQGVAIPLHPDTKSHFISDDFFGSALMNPSIPRGRRTTVTETDLVAIAEVNNYSEINLPAVPDRLTALALGSVQVLGTNVSYLQSNAAWNVGKSNTGDFEPTINDHLLYQWEGVLMAAVAENSAKIVNVDRNSNFSKSSALTPKIANAEFGNDTSGSLSVAYFSYADGWEAGHVVTDGPTDYDMGEGHDSMVNSDIGYIAPGRMTIEVDGAHNLTGGMLFVVGAGHADEPSGDRDNYVSTMRLAETDNWEVAVRDFDQNFASFEHTDVSFVYLPYDSPELGAGGLVNGSDGNMLESEGDFTLTKTDTGVYELELADYNPHEGALLLTVTEEVTIGGITAPADNILTYQVFGDKFIIQGRDMPGTTMQNTSFVFAFLPYVIVPEPASVISMLIVVGMFLAVYHIKSESRSANSIAQK